jgi:hypothetical protein
MARRARARRRIVVDACVGRAAGGEDAEHPVSQACSRCLLAIFNVRLIEAALETDGLVLLTDCEARAAFAKHCGDVAGVAGVTWACPEHHAGAIEWIESGAPDRGEWTLGARPRRRDR